MTFLSTALSVGATLSFCRKFSSLPQKTVKLEGAFFAVLIDVSISPSFGALVLY